MSAAGDLFGDGPRKRDATLVRRELLVDEKVSTRDAWRLAWPSDTPVWQWAPRSLVTRGRGQDAKFFTGPKWLFEDRRWL